MNATPATASNSARPAKPIKLHRHPLSGHCHRVELFLSLLDLPVELIYVDFMARAHKAPEFLKMNPFGEIPVIQDGATTLADANAILVYLASKYAPDTWLPQDPLKAAQVQRWLSVAAGQLAFGPCSARLAVLFDAPINTEEAIARANNLFAVMEQTLQATPFLVGSTPTLADIANYSYIAHAPEGNVSLQPYPHLRAWLTRIEALPRFIPMSESLVGLAA